MGKVLAILNQKGGVGKTTTAVNLGFGLKQLGKKVLLIDFDPQGNLTFHLGYKDKPNLTVYELLKTSAKLESVSFEDVVIHVGDNIDLLPADSRLSGADLTLGGVTSREKLLKKAISPVRDNYDAILIDCPPSLGFLAINAMSVADGVIVPIIPESLPLEGVQALEESIEGIQEEINPTLTIDGVVITKYDKRQNLSKEVIEALQGHFGNKLFNTYIHVNVPLSEAPSFGKDIFSYNPKCRGAEEYLNLSKELLERQVL
mgnify:FL=1